MKEILEQLWDENKERPFALFSVAKLFKFTEEELLNLGAKLGEMHREQSTVDGYRVKRVGDTIYKLMKIVTTGEQPPCDAPGGAEHEGEPLEQDAGQDASRNSCEMGGQREQTEQTTKQAEQPACDQAKPLDPFQAVPQELKDLPQWCVWRSETRDSKPTKVPYQCSGKGAQTNNPGTWIDYQTACKHRERFSGIGFVFSESDRFTGIDLDNCLNAQGKIENWAQGIVDRLKLIAYGEISPSRRGIKFFTRAVLPPVTKHKIYIDETTGEAIEIYDRTRYFTITGHGEGEIGDGQETVDWILSEYASLQAKPSQAKPPSQPPPSRAVSVDEIIDKIRVSRQAAKFNALMRGDTTGYGSPSEADCALCSMLAFWTQDNVVIDAIFRQSRLMRDKWDVKHRSDGATYGKMTIEKSLTGKKETYTPSQRTGGYSKTKRRLWRTKQFYGG